MRIMLGPCYHAVMALCNGRCQALGRASCDDASPGAQWEKICSCVGCFKKKKRRVQRL